MIEARSAPPFEANHLTWPMRRDLRTFNVGVVEPEIYDPAAHSAIFMSVVSHFIQPEPVALDSYDRVEVETPIAFDLITFPEAFAPADSFVRLLGVIRRAGSCGCIHVGLRPTESDNHLFTPRQLTELVEAVEQIQGLQRDDLVSFKAWLVRQEADHRFNVGAVFAVDVHNQVRVCLYPKGLRARVEYDAIPEHLMQEANLLSLVTLQPSNARQKSVTLQPLSCSDAFDHKTERGLPGPIGGLNDHADCLDPPPDHIDIVSVATCTPQPEQSGAKSIRFREWHQDFRGSFERAARTHGRHAFSTFVLSNFRMITAQQPGGLSGVFQPAPPKTSWLNDDVVLSLYGRIAGANNRWSTPDDEDDLSTWSSRGYLATLDPFSGPANAPVRILMFAMPYLLRDRPLWAPELSLSKCHVTVANRTGSGPLTFSRRAHNGD
jgi:hypothetical protein